MFSVLVSTNGCKIKARSHDLFCAQFQRLVTCETIRDFCEWSEMKSISKDTRSNQAEQWQTYEKLWNLKFSAKREIDSKPKNQNPKYFNKRNCNNASYLKFYRGLGYSQWFPISSDAASRIYYFNRQVLAWLVSRGFINKKMPFLNLFIETWVMWLFVNLRLLRG